MWIVDRYVIKINRLHVNENYKSYVYMMKYLQIIYESKSHTSFFPSQTV